MGKFKNNLNNDLCYLTPVDSADDIIDKAHRHRHITITKLTAIAAVIAIIFTIVLFPAKNTNSGFIIVANASTDKSVLNSDEYVELNGSAENYVFYNFNYLLDENAEKTDVVKKYLFYTVNKNIDIRVEGENIEKITYKMNKGALSGITSEKIGDTNNIKITIKEWLGESSANAKSEFTIDYDKQKYTTFNLNLLEIPYVKSFDNNGMYFVLNDTGEITKSYEDKWLVPGYRSDNTLATDEEIKTLKKYIKNDDMVGFYNYQNQIFKRLFEEITLDITVTLKNGETRTQTVEFLYTPKVIKNESEIENYTPTAQSLSSGTLSAKIKK